MIFLYALPLELIGEIIQHQVSIVLCGVLLFELSMRSISPQHDAAEQERIRVGRWILLAVAVLTFGWLTTSYFFNGPYAWYGFVIELPSITILITLLSYFARLEWHVISRRLLIALVSCLAAHLILNVAHTMTEWRLLHTAEVASATMAVLFLYFLAVRYIIRSDT